MLAALFLFALPACSDEPSSGGDTNTPQDSSGADGADDKTLHTQRRPLCRNHRCAGDPPADALGKLLGVIGAGHHRGHPRVGNRKGQLGGQPGRIDSLFVVINLPQVVLVAEREQVLVDRSEMLYVRKLRLRESGGQDI